MIKLREILGAIKSLPATLLVWTFYILPLWRKDLKLVTRIPGRLVWHFHLISKSSWYARKWQGWAGWTGPQCIITKKNPSKTTMVHENTHVDQWNKWGALFPILYGLENLRIRIKNIKTPPDKDKNPYIDNRFEIAARKAAGQTRKVQCNRCKRTASAK